MEVDYLFALLQEFIAGADATCASCLIIWWSVRREMALLAIKVGTHAFLTLCCNLWRGGGVRNALCLNTLRKPLLRKVHISLALHVERKGRDEQKGDLVLLAIKNMTSWNCRLKEIKIKVLYLNYTLEWSARNWSFMLFAYHNLGSGACCDVNTCAVVYVSFESCLKPSIVVKFIALPSFFITMSIR